MKWLILLFVFIFFNGAVCNKKATAGCFKGRLEIKGICMNYVIRVLDGNTALINLQQNWTDETTGKAYENVFALGNRCDFQDVAEGKEFYFTVTNVVNNNCAICEAFRPVPAATNNITVIQTPCR